MRVGWRSVGWTEVIRSENVRNTRIGCVWWWCYKRFGLANELAKTIYRPTGSCAEKWDTEVCCLLNNYCYRIQLHRRNNYFAGPPLPISTATSASGASTSTLGSFATLDNETAACNWLTSQYEYIPGSVITKMEMYRRYVSECSIHGLQRVVNPTLFSNCIRWVQDCDYSYLSSIILRWNFIRPVDTVNHIDLHLYSVKCSIFVFGFVYRGRGWTQCSGWILFAKPI